MSANIETVANLRRTMSFHIPGGDIAHEVQQRLRKIARTVRIDGFRPGKIPMSIIEKRYKTSVVDEVVMDLAKKKYSQEVQKAHLYPAYLPNIVKPSEQHLAQACTEGVPVKMQFEVMPDIQLNDLESLSITRFHASVEEESVDRAIRHLRKQTCTFIAGEPGCMAEMEDRVTVDFDGKIDGEPFEGGHAKDLRFVLGENYMPTEFEKAIEGMTVGESKTFPITFPATYRSQEIAGKTADFMVTLHSIEKVVLPEMTPQWIESVGIANGMMESLRDEIRRNLELQCEDMVWNRNRLEVSKELWAKYPFDIPETLVRKRVEEVIRSEIEMQEMGQEDYGLNVDLAKLPQDFTERIRKDLHWALIVNHLMDKYDWKPVMSQVIDYIHRQAASYQDPEAYVEAYRHDKERMESLYVRFYSRHVIQYIYEHVQVVDQTIPFSELLLAR